MSKENIKVYFVLPTNCEDELSTSEQMQTAFELCRQNQIIPDWIRETDCLRSDFTKKDVLVFDKFEGEIFKQLQALKCLSIAGPWCIITCLLEGLSVPNNKSPVFSMAMNKLTVTASNFSADQKKLLKEKIEMMGGVFSLHITQSVTHLVTNSVKTQKYTIANERSMKVMLDTWVEAVWTASLTRNVKADDQEFSVYKCPVFKNLQVSCTGFDAQERAKLQRIITDNGGCYSGKLIVGTTDTLICNPGIHSDKFSVALRYKIPCLTIKWIHDSIEKGYTIPEENYGVKISSSTPTKNSAPLNPDFSMMSNISTADHVERTSVSETIGNMSLFNLTSASKHKESQKENRVPDAVDEIDLKVVKQAGTFLDGCGVYLTGFSPNRREKLCRILKSAGATRYDDITDRVTQILVGDATTHEMKLITSRGSLPPMVSTKWLMECIRQRQPVYEEPFTVETSSKAPATPSSPLSKKGLTLLKHDMSVVEPEVEKFVEPEPYNDEAASMRMYMQPHLSTREEDTLAQLLAHGDIDSKIDGNQSIQPEIPAIRIETSRDEISEVSSMQEESICPILAGKTFKLVGYTDEEREKVRVIVEEMRGQVVPHSYKGITDYAVAPTICNQVRHTASEIVNDLWVLDCHNRNQLLDAEYFHQPFYVTHDVKPLKNCVITLSGYTSFERTYLMLLLEHLGAVYQDKFARITLSDRSVQGSTHLVCLEPAGSKYLAAVRWGRPAVSHHWLLQCAERAERLDESLYQLEKPTDAPTAAESSKSCFPVTPQPPSVKRDSVGRKLSPVTANEQPQQIPIAVKNETEILEKKFKPVEHNTVPPARAEESTSPFAGFPRLNEAVPTDDVMKELLANADPVISLENGRTILLSNFMQDLRDQGLFDTPSPLPVFNKLKSAGVLPKDATPKRNLASEFSEAGVGCSQGTPVGKYIRDLKERNVLPSTPTHLSTPDSPLPRPFFDVATPDTPLGQFLEENPSRETRKRFQQVIDRFKDFEPPTPRLPSTPWSEVKRQAWAWLLRDKSAEQKNPIVKKLSEEMDDKPAEEVKDTAAVSPAVREIEALEEPQPMPEEPTEIHKQTEVKVADKDDSDTQVEVSGHIGHLHSLLSRRESSSRSSLILSGEKSTPQKVNEEEESTPDASKAANSQDNHIQWAEPMEGVEQTSSETTAEFRLRKFMLSGLEQNVRSSCYTAIKSLGGDVSELSHYDASATHVVCSNPTRNEKILSSMAAGKWIVHVSYVQASVEASKFIDEELFEFGNPKSAPKLAKLVENTSIVESMHWWRTRVLEQGYGAFHGMRSLVFSKNKPALVRLIEAGGGVIVNANPPYSHSVDATHCFIDLKLHMPAADFVPLAEQGIPCLNVLYLSNFLNTRTNCNMKDFLLPDLQLYYS